MFVSTVTSKGQVTLPSRLRSQLNIMPSDMVIFTSDKTRILVEKAPSSDSLFGSLANPKVKGLSSEKINRLVNIGMFAKNHK